MPRFSSDESRIIITFVYYSPKIIGFLDPADGSLLSAYSFQCDSFGFEAHFKYLGDLNGFMYFDAMKYNDSFHKNIIKMSYPIPSNETLK